MELITESLFKKSNMTEKWLLSNDFRYSSMFSDNEAKVYTYRFPVYKYAGYNILECELRVTLGEDVVVVNVYDNGTINRYAPFYYHEYGKYDDEVIKNITKIILNKLKKLGITKVERGE